MGGIPSSLVLSLEIFQIFFSPQKTLLVLLYKAMVKISSVKSLVKADRE